MKHLRLFAFLFCVLLCGLSYSQKTQKKFITKNTDYGMLYFVHAQTLCKSKALVCEFDQTIRTWSDTVSIGVTVTTNETFKVDSVMIDLNSHSVTRNVEHIYTEPYKKKWKCRFFVYATMEEAKKILSAPLPTVRFYGKGIEKSAHIKQKQWNNIVKIDNDILYQVELNK